MNRRPVALVVASLATSIGCAAEYFVATSGDDAAPGTRREPWRTIQHAADLVQPGHTVRIGPGTYRERVTIARSGAEGRAIVLAGDEGGGTGIDGEGIDISDGRGLVQLEGVADVTLANIHVRNSSAVGVHASQPKRITIRDCDVGGSAHSGVFLYGARERSDTVVESCVVHDNRRAGIAVWQDPGGYFTIRRNRVYGNLGVSNYDGIEVIDTPYVAVLDNTVYDNAPEEGRPEGDQIDAGGTNDLTSPSHHVIYEGNVVYGRGGGVKMNNEPLHSIIRRNVIFDCPLVFYEAPTKIAVCHNTVVGAYHALQFWGNGESENFGGTQVRNNLFADSTSYIVNIGNRANPTPESLVLDHNLYRFLEGNFRGINVNAPDFDATFGPGADGLRAFTERTGQEPHGLVTDQALTSMLVDMGARDARLRADGAAIDAGGPLTTVIGQPAPDAIVVRCSWFFHDGWDGLLEPDEIRIGQTTARVKAIDYRSHRIDLADAVEAPPDTPVSLPYHAGAPDCGAYEYCPH